MNGTIGVDIRAGGIGVLTVSNPDKFNAMSLSMWRALQAQVLRLAADAQVRVLVLTGAGDRAFVSGADIHGFAADRSGADDIDAYDAAVHAAQSALAQCVKPTVARIGGVCMGGGIGLALACDLRYACAGARFRMPAARLGLGYARAAMEQVVDALGAAAAMDLFLTARTFEGEQALRLGLVHECVDDAAFDALVDQRIAAVAANAPLTLRAAKAAIRDIARPAGAQQRELIDQWVRACFASADYREGQLAFCERRTPQFRGC